MLHFSAHTGCFVSGLFLEGADWDVEHSCLTKSQPRVLVVELPIVKIIPIEARRLKLQVVLLGDTMAGCLLTSFCFHISIAGSPFPLSTSSTILSLPLSYKVGHLTLCLMLAFISFSFLRVMLRGVNRFAASFPFSQYGRGILGHLHSHYFFNYFPLPVNDIKDVYIFWVSDI